MIEYFCNWYKHIFNCWQLKNHENFWLLNLKDKQDKNIRAFSVNRWRIKLNRLARLTLKQKKHIRKKQSFTIVCWYGQTKPCKLIHPQTSLIECVTLSVTPRRSFAVRSKRRLSSSSLHATTFFQPDRIVYFRETYCVYFVRTDS